MRFYICCYLTVARRRYSAGVTLRWKITGLFPRLRITSPSAPISIPYSASAYLSSISLSISYYFSIVFWLTLYLPQSMSMSLWVLTRICQVPKSFDLSFEACRRTFPKHTWLCPTHGPASLSPCSATFFCLFSAAESANLSPAWDFGSGFLNE